MLPIAPVKNVTNGSEKTKEGLHLPETIKVYGADKASTFLTRVEWDVEGCAYEPKDKKAQTFQVQGKLKFSPGENSDNLDDKVFIEVQVNAYEPLAAPVIDGFRVIRNYVYASLWDRVNEADGYQFVAVRNAEDLVKGNFAAQCETAELSAQVKYIPQGDYLLYCRSFKEGENAKEYGAWSQGEKIQINVTTPKAPVIKKATVKNCDVLLKISTPEKVEGFDAVLARDSRGTEPLDYALVKTGYSGDSNEILLRGAAKGTYLVGIHSYQYGEGGKVLSRWSNLVKVTVKKGKVTTAPVIKKVSVSGRTITIQSTVPKGTHGYDWVLGKDCYYSETEGLLQPFNYAYVQKNKTAGKIVFKNVKPGTYYLSGHAYVKGYKKYFTNWAKPRRIVIK